MNHLAVVRAMRTGRWGLVGLVALLAACGGGGGGSGSTGTTPVPTATLSLTPASGTVTAGGSVTTTATITRGGGFAGTVTVGATGIPPGVTVTGGTIAAGTTTQTVTIATSNAASPGTATLAITGAATGVTLAPVDFALTVNAAPPGVLLSGPPTDPAMDRLVFQAPIPAQPEDAVDGVLLTRVMAFIAADATVAEVNAALDAVGGRIVSMRPGEPGISVAVPRQVDPASLKALADSFAGLPGIRSAYPGDTGEEKEAPPVPANSETNLLHLRDTRFVAAWNARRAAQNCVSDRVVVLVVDAFRQGNGTDFGFLFADFTTQLPGVIGVPPPPTQTGALKRHGYDVLSTMAAAWDSAPPTGALPFADCLDIRPLPRDGVDNLALANAIEAALPATGKVIASHAWGYKICRGCDQSDPASVTLNRAREMADIAVVHRSMLNRHSQRLLTVSAAGNERDEDFARLYPGFAVADYDSPMNIAGRSDAQMTWITNGALWDPQCSQLVPCLVPSLVAAPVEETFFRSRVLPADPAANVRAPVLIVGSVTRGNNEISDFSEFGDVYAVGEAIPMIPGDAKRGSSFAAPQVSALAAYLWILSPELRARPVADTIAAISANTCNTANCADIVTPLRTTPCQASIGCADVIDAYATVLSLDSGQALSPSDSRVRLALLDVNNNGTFDGTDLFAFREAYRPGGEPIDPITWDDSRHDLNGDGFTGGSRRAPFDLDPSSSPRFGRAALTQVTAEIATELITYDESGVTDAEVLCYYAYSDLYDASTPSALQSRETHLENICVPIAVTIEPQSATIPTGQTVQFTATVSGTGNPDVTWSLPNGGGTISADGLFTAGAVNGTYAVRAASAADPAATATVFVTVGVARSWVGTITFTSQYSQTYVTNATPVDSPESQIQYASLNYTESTQQSATVTVPVEITLQGVLGTVEDFALGDATGSGSYDYEERGLHVYWFKSLPGCVIELDRGREVHVSGADATADGVSLQLGSAGNYTLFFSSAQVEASGTERRWFIESDAPSNTEDCVASSSNYDYTEPALFSAGAVGNLTQVSGVILNGEIAGSTTETSSSGDPGSGTSTRTDTVSWRLRPR